MDELVNRAADFEKVEQIISGLPSRFASVLAEGESLKEFKTLTRDLAALIFDKNLRLLKKMYETLSEIRLSQVTKEVRDAHGHESELVDEVMLNLFAQGCNHFGEQELLAEVFVRASVLDFKIDMQTYFKCQLNLLYADETGGQSESQV